MYEAALGFSALCYFIMLIYFVRSPMFSIFHPMSFYAAFHGIIFVIRPIMIVVGNYSQGLYRVYEFSPSLSDKITVILASNLGFLAFSWFCMRNGKAPFRFTETPAIQEERRRLGQIFIWVIVICAPAAIYSLARNFGENSVFEGLVRDGSTGVAYNTTNNGYITDLQMLAVPLCSLFIWQARFRLYSFLPLAGFVIFRAGSGGRYPAVMALVSTSLFYLYQQRRRLPKTGMIIAVMCLVIGFSAVGSDRGAAIRQAVGLEEKDAFTASASESENPLLGMDFANMEFFEFLVYVIPQRSGTYDYFLDNLQVFTEPIPRLWWTGKPRGEPLRRITLFDHGFPIGMTRSLPGEGWYAFGWLGVILWCGLWGAFLGRVYNNYVTGPQTTFRTACYMVFLPTLIMVFRDGTLLMAVRATGVYFTPIALWYVLARYLGVPNAEQIAAVWRKQRTAMVARGVKPRPEDSAALAALPPAVRRRRLAQLSQYPAASAE